MKLAVIALDYDGTIARHDRLDPAVREAIGAARARGIAVLLVTGRILGELQRVAGDLHFVDGVIAENGAILHFPHRGHTSTLAPAIPAAFVDEVRRRGIEHQAGSCLLDADARAASQLLEVIRAMELPLVLLFNGGRVMVLAQGVSKATGLKAMLDTLRLSARNTLAIGDAENDHELVRLAEIGVAVAWGSAALGRAADAIIPGEGPPAVAAYLRALAETAELPVAARARRRLRLGYTLDGAEFSLAVRGRNVLVAGDAKSGKSWVAGLLCEQLILHGYCVCVIDPEGDYRSLEALPGVTVLGGEDPPPTPKDLLRAMRYPDRSVVIDLSTQPQDEKIEYIRALLPALNEIRRQSGLPHRILVDEAHYFLHDADARHLLDFDRNGYTVVTYWASRLPAQLLAATEVMIVTRESNAVEIEALRERCASCEPVERSRWSALAHLKPGEAIALPVTVEAGGDLRLFTLGPRITPHVRHRTKYVDVPVSERRAFYFAASGGIHTRTLRHFVHTLETVPGEMLGAYLLRHDFSRWIGDVFGDRLLAAEVHALEDRHAGTPGPDTVLQIANAVRARYDIADDIEEASVSGSAETRAA